MSDVFHVLVLSESVIVTSCTPIVAKRKKTNGSVKDVRPLVEKYGSYTTDYDENTSVKRIKTLCKGTASNTAVWIVSYGAFTIQ